MTLDGRYAIALEWCGRRTPRWVARFCDRWLGQARTRAGAERIARAHRRAFLAWIDSLAIPGGAR